MRFRSSLPADGNVLNYSFAGSVTGSGMAGEVQIGEYGKARWHAVRHGRDLDLLSFSVCPHADAWRFSASALTRRGLRRCGLTGYCFAACPLPPRAGVIASHFASPDCL